MIPVIAKILGRNLETIMKEKFAIATLAVAAAFSGAAAEAHDHDHGHGGGHRHGPGIELYIAPAPMYRAPPPPGYYRQPAPPVYVVPQLPPVEVDCYDKTNVDRYGYQRYSGSVRTYQDQNTGGTFQSFTRQPCF
jgi:hypothetical protein